MIIGGIIGDMDGADAGNFSCGFGNSANIAASDENIDITEFQSGGDSSERGVFEFATFMFCPDE